MALITGASRGIGRESALRLGEAGALVAVNDNSSGAQAADGVREMRALAVQADVSDPAAWNRW